MFDPEKVDIYEYTWDSSDRSGDMYSQTSVRSVVDGDEFVLRENYNQLLEQYKMLSGRPETRQLCTKHKWIDTGGQLASWPPIKVYRCLQCLLTGNLQGRILTPNGFPQYDLSDMTYEGCPENGQK